MLPRVPCREHGRDRRPTKYRGCCKPASDSEGSGTIADGCRWWCVPESTARCSKRGSAKSRVHLSPKAAPAQTESNLTRSTRVGHGWAEPKTLGVLQCLRDAACIAAEQVSRAHLPTSGEWTDSLANRDFTSAAERGGSPRPGLAHSRRQPRIDSLEKPPESPFPTTMRGRPARCGM
jgi:hypothetical protein